MNSYIILISIHIMMVQIKRPSLWEETCRQTLRLLMRHLLRVNYELYVPQDAMWRSM